MKAFIRSSTELRGVTLADVLVVSSVVLQSEEAYEPALPTGPIALIVLVASLAMTVGWLWYLLR